MPNRPFHIATSTPAGAGYAFYKANQQNGLARAVEALGGALGGYCGGILPDCIDPPFHSGHRSLGHGLVPVAAAGTIWNQVLDGWQNQLRRIADEHNYRRSLSADPASGRVGTLWPNGHSACLLVFWQASARVTLRTLCSTSERRVACR